jgi:hypothetical protein
MISANFTVKFKINYECAFGDVIYVIGNAPELGSWNFHQAVKLNWNEVLRTLIS